MISKSAEGDDCAWVEVRLCLLMKHIAPSYLTVRSLNEETG